jgi:hypothetical protein
VDGLDCRLIPWTPRFPSETTIDEQAILKLGRGALSASEITSRGSVRFGSH